MLNTVKTKKTRHLRAGFLLVTLSGFKPETFWAVIRCAIQLRHKAGCVCKDIQFSIIRKGLLKKILVLAKQYIQSLIGETFQM